MQMARHTFEFIALAAIGVTVVYLAALVLWYIGGYLIAGVTAMPDGAIDNMVTYLTDHGYKVTAP